MTSERERPPYTPFDRLTDEELREAMIMHIRMGYILVHPGKSSDAEAVARDMVNRLSLDQLREIHPHTFFANKSMGSAPKNPYVIAKEMLKEP
jgi:hypothetical protein